MAKIFNIWDKGMFFSGNNQTIFYKRGLFAENRVQPTEKIFLEEKSEKNGERMKKNATLRYKIPKMFIYLHQENIYTL